MLNAKAAAGYPLRALAHPDIGLGRAFSASVLRNACKSCPQIPRRRKTTTRDSAAGFRLSRAGRDWCQRRITAKQPEDKMDQPDIAARIAAAKTVVETYLTLSMIPDPVAASAYLAPDFELIFTGGRRMAGPTESAAFNAKRYLWVKKRFLRTDAAYDPQSGTVHVYNTGYLYGLWPDGVAFETNRYLDKFELRDGKITRCDVWNDSAEVLLHKAGLAEAAL